jgi:hypothetical protein
VQVLLLRKGRKVGMEVNIDNESKIIIVHLFSISLFPSQLTQSLSLSLSLLSLSLSLRSPLPLSGQTSSGLYYKHIMIIIDAASVVSK